MAKLANRFRDMKKGPSMEKLAGRVMLSWGAGRAAIAFLAGATGALAMQPFGFFAAFFVSFTVLVWLLDGAPGNPDRGFLGRLWPSFVIGWLFGFGYFVAGLWWLAKALLVDGTQYLWALPFALFGLQAYLALFFGLAAAIARAFWSEGMGRIFALAVAFGLAEWLRSFVLTGFPWNAVGYGIMPFPLMMQSVHLVGLYGMNVLAVFIFASPALIGTKRGMFPGLVLAVLLFAGHLGFGAYRLAQPLPETTEKSVTVRLVQPQVPVSGEVDDAARARIFDQHMAMSAQTPEDGKTRPDIIIWPETAIPFILSENQDAYARIGDMLQDGQILISGAVRDESVTAGQEPRYYNSIYVFDDKGQVISAADKVHLVPFGEFLPFGKLFERLGVNAVAAMPGGFSAGASHAVFTPPGKPSLYPLICYEAIFPYEITAAGEAADVLLNITNDTWFGNSPGPYQHFHQAQIRAVEVGKPLIRSANSGISAVVNQKGEIVAGFALSISGVFDTTIPSKTVPIVDSSQRQMNFWLIMALGFAIAFFSRVSFIFNKN
jgi:apolipoprotein N-acyltransferase